MEVTQQQENKIKQIIRYYETGKSNGSDYGALTIYNDGPNKIKQITYGAYQTTEFSGGLKNLLLLYIQNKGVFSEALHPYFESLGKLPSLSDNTAFLHILGELSKDPIMHQTQDEFFDKAYYNPAVDWCTKEGLTLPLSLLVIFDSYIHSGGILSFLRDKFTDKLPYYGGDEKKWIIGYVNARDIWLETNKSYLLQKSDYRTDSFIYAIRHNNWDLSQPFDVVNYKTANELDNPVIQQII